MSKYSHIIIIIHFFLVFSAKISFANGNHHKQKNTVILLHGIMNRPFVMRKIQRALKRQGFHVVNWGYPSRDLLIEQHAENLASLIGSLEAPRKIHFVGFSQGAIIIRYYLTHYPLGKIGRFVMIAPPNHGSEKAEHLYRYAWFRWIFKDKSVKQLFASRKDFHEACGIPPVEYGIIAGGKGDGRGYSRLLPGDNDSSVSVESTHLEGEKDFILLRHQHTMLLFSRDTVRNVLSFLQTGHFLHQLDENVHHGR